MINTTFMVFVQISFNCFKVSKSIVVMIIKHLFVQISINCISVNCNQTLFGQMSINCIKVSKSKLQLTISLILVWEFIQLCQSVKSKVQLPVSLILCEFNQLYQNVKVKTAIGNKLDTTLWIQSIVSKCQIKSAIGTKLDTLWIQNSNWEIFHSFKPVA